MIPKQSLSAKIFDEYKKSEKFAYENGIFHPITSCSEDGHSGTSLKNFRFECTAKSLRKFIR